MNEHAARCQPSKRHPGHRLPALLRVLVVAAMLSATLPDAGSAAPHRPDVSERIVRTAQMLPGLAAQAVSDEDELEGIRLAPVDPGLDPDAVMRSRPFVIGDAAYGRGFPDSPKVESNVAYDSEEGARQALADFLALRGADSGTIETALARFDERKVKKIVPSPRLRASLLMMSGWEPYHAVIPAVLDGENPSGEPFLIVEFNDLGMEGAIATLGEDPASGRYILTVHYDHAEEDPEVLIPTVLHEALHGGENSAEEEVIANILDTICWAELLGIKPELAHYGTELTWFENFKLVGLLNSVGRAGPEEIGVATSFVGDVYVGLGLETTDAESLRGLIEADWFYDALRNVGSDGQYASAALVSRFPGAGELGDVPRFDERMLAVIDAGVHKLIPAKRAVELAAWLGLEMVAAFKETKGKGKLSDDFADCLERRPFVANDPKRFHYREGKKTGKPWSEEKAREELLEFLSLAGADAAVTADLINRYDAGAVKELAPDHALRAGVLMLGALHPWSLILPAVFDGKNPDAAPLRILYEPMRDSAPAARRSDRDGKAAPALLVNSLLVGESPQVLASVIVEALLLHDDRLVQAEAIAAATLGTLAWADVIKTDPDAAAARTWGALQRNQYVLALLNTTASRGTIGILGQHAEIADILPGVYADARTFAEYIDGRPWGSRFDRYAELVAPNIFGRLLVAVGREPTLGAGGRIIYGKATLSDLDSAILLFLAPEEALAVANALKLRTAIK